MDEKGDAVALYFTANGSAVSLTLEKVADNQLKGKIMKQFDLSGERLTDDGTVKLAIPKAPASPAADDRTHDATDDIRKNLQDASGSGAARMTSMQATHVTNATLTVQVNQSRGHRLPTEKYNNSPGRAEDVKFYNEQGLHGKIYKLWLGEEAYYDKSTQQYTYEQSVLDYFEAFSKSSDALLANFSGRGLLGTWGLSAEQCQPILTHILRDLKSRFPRLVYIEVMNEPDYANLVKPETYYTYYKIFTQAVNEVNATLKPAVPLQIGGPATAQLEQTWLPAFLDAYKNDASPTKRLDFISYHGYFTKPGATYFFYKDDPSLVKDQRAVLDKELSRRGLRTSIPAFVTETGIYPGPRFDDANNMKNDQLRRAAGVAALFYWYSDSKNTYPFNWVMRHPKEGRKDQLVTHDTAGNALPYVDKFTPYGNTLVMMAKLKKERVAAVTSTTISKGKGLYAVATKDSSGVSVMTWNYQSKGTEGYRVECTLLVLPAQFNGKNIRAKTYRIDAHTSNYDANLANANLQLVEDKIVANAGAFHQSFSVAPNTLQLLVLEPVD